MLISSVQLYDNHNIQDILHVIAPLKHPHVVGSFVCGGLPQYGHVPHMQAGQMGLKFPKNIQMVSEENELDPIAGKVRDVFLKSHNPHSLQSLVTLTIPRPRALFHALHMAEFEHAKAHLNGIELCHARLLVYLL
jgi:hypothetical protein